MAASLKVPTIFEAIDRITAPITRMMAKADALGSKLQATANRAERAFRALTPSIGDAGRQLLDFASTAAIAASIVAGVQWGVSQLIDYENAVAKFRVIVSDLTDNEFQAYQKEIGKVATATKASSVAVAQSFETIAGLNADFAKTADGLGAVSAAAITLAKAGRTDLQPTAENLVGIMNQFSFGALEADRTINVLAAGQAVGAASIAETSEAFKNFGSTAASYNITLEQSVALVQVLASKQIKGAEAGTKLRGSITKLSDAGFGYVNGVFNINAALTQAQKKMASFSTEQERNAFVTKTFGLENMSAGLILLNNVKAFDNFTTGVTGTTEATKAAAIQSATLSAKIEEMQGKFTTLLTTSDSASVSLNAVKAAIGFITNNMELFMGAGLAYVGVLVTAKLVTIAATAATAAYNVAIGVMGAVTGIASVAIGQSTIAMRAYNITTKLMALYTWGVAAAQTAWAGITSALTTAQIALNVAMYANPIGLIVLAIVALVAAVAVAISHYEKFGAVLLVLLGPIGMVVNAIMTIRRNWDGIVQAFQSEGIIGGLKRIGATIFDMVLYPLQQALQLASNLPGFLGGNLAADAAANIENFRSKIGVVTEATAPPASAGGVAATVEPLPAVTPQSSMVETIREFVRTQQSTLNIDFKNLPKGVEVGGQFNDLTPSLTSTYGG